MVRLEFREKDEFCVCYHEYFYFTFHSEMLTNGKAIKKKGCHPVKVEKGTRGKNEQNSASP